MPHEADVELKVYNVLGEEVKTLVDKVEAPGDYTTTFSAEELSSGVYIYKMRATSEVSGKTYTKIVKMILQK